ncbi:MAG TPA: dipeptidase [Thermogutta sp.]|nr:dipeptidase [Thermogutta sp.]
MDNAIARVKDFLEAHRTTAEQFLSEFLAIPSVSADPQHRPDMKRAAEWVAQFFSQMGLAAELIQSPTGHPVVYAETPHCEGIPTVLIYGHYDVQPAEDPTLWQTPPFEPTIRGGAIYARGASDDKGQVLTHLLSVGAWYQVTKSWPLNFKFVIEGEEEVGSSVLEKFLDEQADRLACDCIVISDGNQFGPDQPAITYGLRGIAYFELRVKGPHRDLHSGSFGGTVTNPATALTRMLGQFMTQDGRVAIPGFYDDVLPLSNEERRRLRELPFDEPAFWASLGVETAWGEPGYTVLERRWARPTFEVCGLWGGYQGDGAKTVIPANAGAKISFRLVPHQDPDRIREALLSYLAQICPPGVQYEVIDLHASPAVLTSLDSPYIKAAENAVKMAFSRSPVFTREGGSIPIVSRFQQRLGADVLLLGWGQDDDNTHAPNEKFSLADFHRGTLASAYLWEFIRQIGKATDS